MKRFLVFLSLLVAVVAPAGAASLNEGQTRALNAYLTALTRGNYREAYALLAPVDQKYYRSAANFASVFTADRFVLKSFTISGAPVSVAQGAVAAVSEKVDVLDPVHQTVVSLTLPTHYGIVEESGSYRVRDPRHPWKSFAPAGATAAQDKVAVTIRKVSFYPDRIEVIANFSNSSDGNVTFFPYGRSVIHDDAGRVYSSVDSRIAARLDNDLFLGLRLPSSAQYTGVVAFRFADPSSVPAKLAITIAPIVREGAEAPIELAIPPISVPG